MLFKQTQAEQKFVLLAAVRGAHAVGLFNASHEPYIPYSLLQTAHSIYRLDSICSGISSSSGTSLSLQAGFNASARMCVRDLRKTETTDIIMLYSGTMQGVLAFVACVTVPRSLVAPQHGWQYALLLLTGNASLSHVIAPVQ